MPQIDRSFQIGIHLGFNFAAEFGGRLTYIQQPEEIATASGEVVIEQGRYRAYGQDLTITNGTFRFAGGPVDDPGLAIRAVRGEQTPLPTLADAIETMRLIAEIYAS